MKSASLAHRDDRDALAVGSPPLQGDAQLTQTQNTSLCQHLYLPEVLPNLSFLLVQVLPLQGSHRQTAGGESHTARDFLLQ